MSVLMSTPASEHELGAFYGSEALGYWAVCGGDECGLRVDGAHPAEVVDAYEQHCAALCLEPGVGKARAALAEALGRGKRTSTTELETTR